MYLHAIIIELLLNRGASVEILDTKLTEEDGYVAPSLGAHRTTLYMNCIIVVSQSVYAPTSCQYAWRHYICASSMH